MEPSFTSVIIQNLLLINVMMMKTNTGMVQVYWAVPPRQGTLKGVEEVPEDPRQDHVVEQTN